MEKFKILCTCQMCDSEYQMGPHLYAGKHIASYDLDVCKACYDGNWDGWAPHYGERLVVHLKGKGIPIPEKNDKGWYPRGEDT